MRKNWPFCENGAEKKSSLDNHTCWICWYRFRRQALFLCVNVTLSLPLWTRKKKQFQSLSITRIEVIPQCHSQILIQREMMWENIPREFQGKLECNIFLCFIYYQFLNFIFVFSLHKGFYFLNGNGPDWRFISWKELGPLQNRHEGLKYWGRIEFKCF